jgi:NitT/TauT family transport system ATP-binding protein
MSDALLQIQSCCQSFPKPDGKELLVLNDINFTLKQGEIVGLLGRSGSGKSTLLRLISGLARPTAGSVVYRGHQITGPAPGIAMVFQTFALFPWLTVLENVELGLEALGLPGDDVRRRALAGIDLIGLDGYESAYPRELSGGMRQRVGFARALVVNPDVLLMDEPFSALDVLTAETLRTDFLDLWSEGRLPIKGVILVTHNIEEAVLMCDRILVFSRDPGHIVEDIKVDLAQPRSRVEPAFRDLVERIYVALTARAAPIASPLAPQRAYGMGIDMVLPPASANLIAGLIEAVAGAPYNGKADLPVIASALQMEVDDLFPVAEALQLFRFAEIEGGDIRLTDTGRQFAEAGTDDRKKLFQRELLNHVPLAAHIRRVLQERANHTAPRRRFREELEDHMAAESVKHTLQAVIAWARFSEAFAYDARKELFSLDNPT